MKLLLTRKRPKPLTVRFLVDDIKVEDNVLSFWHNGIRHRFDLENYDFTVDNEIKK